MGSKIQELADFCRRGEAQQAKTLLSQTPGLLSTRDDSGRIPFHWAASGGNVELVQLLFSSATDESLINDTDDIGWTALMIAASAGHAEIVRFLLRAGADVGVKNCNGQTSLHYAASKEHLQIANTLLEAGLDINARDKYGSTALHRAASKGNSKMVHLLLNTNKCQLNLADCEGNTPLHLACEEDRSDVAVALVKSGAHLDRQNKEQKTALEMAQPNLRKTLARIAETG